MRKILSLILVICMIFAICGCSNNQQTETQPQATLPIVESIPNDEPTKPTTKPVRWKHTIDIVTQIGESEIIQDESGKEFIRTVFGSSYNDIFNEFKHGFIGVDYVEYYDIAIEDVYSSHNGEAYEHKIININRLIGSRNDTKGYAVLNIESNSENYANPNGIELKLTHLPFTEDTQENMFQSLKPIFGTCAEYAIYGEEKDGMTYNGKLMATNGGAFMSEIVDGENYNYYIERFVTFNLDGTMNIILRAGIINDNVRTSSNYSNSLYYDMGMDLASLLPDTFGGTNPFEYLNFFDYSFKLTDVGYVNTKMDKLQFMVINHADGSRSKQIQFNFSGVMDSEAVTTMEYIIGARERGGETTDFAIDAVGYATGLYDYEVEDTYRFAVNLSGGLFPERKIYQMRYNDAMPGIGAAELKNTFMGVESGGVLLISPPTANMERLQIKMDIGKLHDIIQIERLDPSEAIFNDRTSNT